MISVSEKYKLACDSNQRSSYVIAKYGLFNKEAKTLINTYSANTPQLFSSIENTFDETKENVYKYISNEPNRVNLDGSFAFVQNKEQINTNQKIGYWSKEMSDDNGVFATPISITYNFKKEIAYSNLILYFDEVIEKMKVQYYLNNAMIYEKAIDNNDKLIVDTTNEQNSNPIQYFDKLIIIIYKTKEANRYAKLNEIDFGSYKIFSNSDIKKFNSIDELSKDGSQNYSNYCEITINDKNGEYDLLNPYNNLQYIQKEQKITLIHYLKVGAGYREVPLGTYLLKDIKHANKELTLVCYDEIYFMNKKYYGSKFYENESAKNVLRDFFNFINYSENKYEIDEYFDTIYLSGYIPVVETKEALRLICESCRGIIINDKNGVIKIKSSFGNPVKYFKLGQYQNSQPSQTLYNNIVSIDEYTYTIKEELVELYNAKLSKGQHIIEFKQTPIVYKQYNGDPNELKTEANENYQIIDLYATSCVVNVLQDTEVKLSGKIYNETYSTKDYKREDVDTNVDEYVKTSISNKLINSTNIQSVADWKLSQGNLKYSFKCKSLPYIEKGDVCRIELPYKNYNGEKIVRDFVVTRTEFDNSLLETIEGE